MKINRESLISIGFTHRYKPSVKQLDKNSLGYSFLFKGNSITIDVFFVESLNNWKIRYIQFEGADAFALLKKELTDYNIESVVDFVKRHPAQTF